MNWDVFTMKDIHSERHHQFPELWENLDDTSDWVYFILAYDGSQASFSLGNAEYVKIGLSSDPDKRMQQIKNGGMSSPLHYEIWSCVRGGRELEKRLHKFLKKYRVQGEWFRICSEVLEVLRDAPESGEAASRWSW